MKRKRPIDKDIILSRLPKNNEELYLITHPKGATGERIGEQGTFKISRRYLLHAPAIERNLFSELTEPTEETDIVISGLTKKVSELDLASLTFAVGKILYDQSHTARNEEYNTGLYSAEDAKTTDGLRRGGYIVTSIIDLCRIAYGTKDPTSAQKKKMKSLIELVDTTPVTFTFPNGDRLDSKIFTTMNGFTKADGGATYIDLAINPIFCGNFLKNDYGLFPHDSTLRLTEALRSRGERPTAQHYWLMEWLSAQRETKPKAIGLDNLLRNLNLTEYYRKDRKKAEKKLESLFASMRGIGLLRSDLDENPVRGFRQADAEPMFTFYINPDWSKPTSSNLLPE